MIVNKEILVCRQSTWPGGSFLLHSCVDSFTSLWSGEVVRANPNLVVSRAAVKEKGRGLEADLQSVFPRFTTITCCEHPSYFPLIFISHSVLYNLKLAAKYLL